MNVATNFSWFLGKKNIFLKQGRRRIWKMNINYSHGDDKMNFNVSTLDENNKKKK